MKVTLTFEKKDFATLREFEKAVEKQCGKTYVSGSYLCWYFDFPAELQTLLSPVQRGSDAYKAMAAKLAAMPAPVDPGANLQLDSTSLVQASVDSDPTNTSIE